MPELASRIDAVSIDERPILVADGATLAVPVGARRVAVRFAAPSLAAIGHPISFRYRIAGTDADWIVTDEPVATYTNLAPGAHRFEAQARVAGAEWGPAAALAVDVEPRIWQTTWFRIAAVAALLALLYAAHRSRLAIVVRRQRRLERIVEERTAELADANAHLEERVEHAVSELREAERMAAYGQMIAAVAHEVRQPVFALGNAAHVLAKKLGDRDDVARQVSLVQRETKRMNGIVDELLEFARPAALAKASVRPATLLAEARDLFRVEHDPDATVSVTSDADPDLPRITVDEARLLQVLVNLMANAKKHAAGVTTIALRVRIAERCTIEVENDGATIDPQLVPRIFEPFVTGAGDRGTGLGLAIARRIVTDHGGELTVVTTPTTTFQIHLPT